MYLIGGMPTNLPTRIEISNIQQAQGIHWGRVAVFFALYVFFPVACWYFTIEALTFLFAD